MLNRRTQQHGVTLIEIIIGLVIASSLLMLGTVGFRDWTQNARIRAEAESVRSGLQLARVAAVQVNGPVRFQFTTSVDDECVLSATGVYWVVSQANPAGQCANTNANPPGIFQVGGGDMDGATNAALNSDQNTLVFTGTGQTQGNTTMTINISNSLGTCRAKGGTLHCLRVTVSTGGQIRMCDPAVPDGIGAC
ncbi:GspH/FimT family pseudopilin [Methylomagnum ishizawai]|uniref:GspH/FimT family pseudopilin n=1 Tax=Methylomagnum ishizawai TaxID=1760988 RepID=UPI001C33E857|nr:GspH/FimT family pseudopilin [Methylomagnum ishizawai]BBL75094.1 hypothetical protein MishRS11D_21920 [Methylomagnum ishizawai]